MQYLRHYFTLCHRYPRTTSAVIHVQPLRGFFSLVGMFYRLSGCLIHKGIARRDEEHPNGQYLLCPYLPSGCSHPQHYHWSGFLHPNGHILLIRKKDDNKCFVFLMRKSETFVILSQRHVNASVAWIERQKHLFPVPLQIALLPCWFSMCCN